MTKVNPEASNHTPDKPARGVYLSYEFFPPKNEKMEATLWKSIRKLEPLAPDFVSVTYGAGGTTRERTHRTVTRVVNETNLAPAAHLTCVDASQNDIDDIAKAYWANGVRHIVALRGDSPDGVGEAYKPHPEGYAYGSDLVAGLKRIADFEVSVSAYPERHPESPSWDAELDNLKRKIDAGATRAITQYFFGADTFLEFQERAAAAHIDIPIVPGIMLQPNFSGLKRMSGLCGIEVPQSYHKAFEGTEDLPDERKKITEALTADLVTDLRSGGVKHFHLYTLNRAGLAIAISDVLGIKPVNESEAA